MNKQDILNAYNFRHACKAYDPSRKISDEDFQFLLETARLSPSSFGLEAWKILVIENPEIRKEIGDIAWAPPAKPPRQPFGCVLRQNPKRLERCLPTFHVERRAPNAGRRGGTMAGLLQSLR